MEDHLTSDQLARYVKRVLSSAELIAADDHLAACEPCRQRVCDPQGLEDAVAFLRHDLETQAKLEPTHIEYEQLESYVDNEMDEADREIVDSHVGLCRTCRDELRDLQRVRVSLEGREVSSFFSHGRRGSQAAFNQHFSSAFGHQQSTEPLTLHSSASGRDTHTFTGATGPRESVWEKASRFWRYPGYLAGAASAVAIALVVLLFVPSLRYASKRPNASWQSGPSGAGQVPPYVTAGPESLQELQTPAQLAALIGKTETLLGTFAQGARFALLTPVGTFVEDAQPSFRWQPLTGATSYKVTVFDTALDEVAASPALSGTDWKSSARLKRGKIYLWQVAATRNGEQVVAPAPPAPEAKFEVLDLSQANGLEQLKRKQPNAHFVLGRAYANTGVLDEAEQEFRLVPDSDANWALAQKFIRDLEALRRPGQ